MNLIRIGDTVLNLDRISGILDHQHPADPGGPAGVHVIRVMFDGTTIELAGIEAQAFRQWFRHASRSLLLHKDEDGEDLVSPEDQLARVSDQLLALIDHARPRNAAVRQAAHRLSGLIKEYMTGELRHVRARSFERSLADSDSDAEPAPGSSPARPSRRSPIVPSLRCAVRTPMRCAPATAFRSRSCPIFILGRKGPIHDTERSTATPARHALHGNLGGGTRPSKARSRHRAWTSGSIPNRTRRRRAAATSTMSRSAAAG